jgi:hypothetical protein
LECADGMMITRAGKLDYSLRSKLAGVVVNYTIQHLGLRYVESFMSKNTKSASFFAFLIHGGSCL